MSEISKGARVLGAICPKCNHPQRSHMRQPRVDQQRLKGSMKPVFSTCSDCSGEHKECLYYISKRKDRRR